MARLDEILPAFDFDERHTILVAAPPAPVYRAVMAVTSAEMPLLRILFAMRSLPGLLARRGGLASDSRRPLLAQLREYGFAMLAEEPGRELVLGLVDQPWKARAGTRKISGTDEFAAFRDAGYVKAAMNFRLTEERSGTRVETVTRVAATDPASRRKFARYWRVIRPGSGLARRSWLRAIKRRAESERAG
ncbi:MAG: hypothetical protein H0U03_07175 [Actinobacteria bacterium]|nr:hypothetical protein [Actinomycetota bacterium]